MGPGRLCVSIPLISLKKSLTRANRNISSLGLVIVVSVTLSISILSILLLKFLIFVSRFRSILAPRIDRWIHDGVWQLQRRAYEGHGHHGWMSLETEIPLKRTQELLPYLPVWRIPQKMESTRERDGQNNDGPRLTGLWRRVFYEEDVAAMPPGRVY